MSYIGKDDMEHSTTYGSVADPKDTEIARLTADNEALRAQLKHWQTCENCGEPLHGPGICDKAVSEQEKGLELMLDQALDRAESAEAQLLALRQERETGSQKYAEALERGVLASHEGRTDTEEPKASC